MRDGLCTDSEEDGANSGFDKVTRASLAGIHEKARAMDRGHNATAAPACAAPGVSGDVAAHASTAARDAETRASDGADVRTHSTGGADVQTRASDA